MTKNEIVAPISEIASKEAAALVDLGELQLALVGGGVGTVLWG